MIDGKQDLERCPTFTGPAWQPDRELHAKLYGRNPSDEEWAEIVARYAD